MDIFDNNNCLKLSQKRWVCLFSVSKLLEIVKIPDIQRNLDDDHVNKIFESQVNLFNEKGYYDLGILSLCYVEDTNNYWLIDGQHRYSTIMKLYNNIEFEVYISIYSVKNEKERDNIYHTINLNKPTAIAKNSNIDLEVSKFLRTFEKNYKEYIKNSRNPQRPNINIDVFREKIIEFNLVEILNFNDFENEFLNEIKLLSIYYKNI